MNKPRRDPYLYQYRSDNTEPQWSGDQSPGSSESKSFQLMRWFDSPRKIISLVGVVIFGLGVALYTFLTPDVPSEPGEIPLIKPLEGATKVRPENPGGIQVPHQDKLIYDRLNPQAQAESEPQLAETPDLSYPPLHVPEATQEILPPAGPAQPQQVASQPLPAGQNESANFDAWPKATPPHLAVRRQALPQPQPQVQQQPPVVHPLQPQPEVVGAPSLEEALPTAPPPGVGDIPAEAPQNIVPSPEVEQLPQPLPAPVENVAPKALAKPKATALAPAKASAKTAVIGAHSYRLQVGSLASQKQAEEEKKRLWSKHGALLSKYQGKIIRVDLGAKGVRYRIIVGPLPNEGQSKNLCQKLNQQKVGCLVMRPGV